MAKITDGVVCIIPSLISLIPLTLVNLFFVGETVRTLISGILFLSLAITAMIMLGQCYLLVVDGQTFGKRHYRLRVVSPEGQLVRWSRVLVLRSLVPTILLLSTGGVSAVLDWVTCFRADDRCLHDHLAGTIVVEA